MKIRKIIVALSSLLMLCSCSKDYEVPPIMGNGGQTGNKPVETLPDEGGNTENNPIKNTDPIDIYLVLSPIGLYNGEKGKSIEDKMLENAIVFNAKPGEDLPTKENVSAIAGSNGVFDSWVSYEGTGFPTVYTKVPDTPGKILYATFINGDGSSTPVNPVDPSNPNKMTTIYLDATQKLNSDDDQTWATSNPAITMHVWSYSTGASENIKMTNNGNGIYSANVCIDIYTNVVFVRHAEGTAVSFKEGEYWNKTGDLLFVADMNCFKITSWNDGGYWTTR